MAQTYWQQFATTSVPPDEVRELADAASEADPGAGYEWAARILDRLSEQGWRFERRWCGVACPIGVIAAPCSLAEGHAGRHQTGLMTESQSSPKYRIEWDQ